MIIARAPLRVSFGGGGTDLAAYYQEYGGLVLSVSIDRYIYAMLSPHTGSVQITSSEQRSPIPHALVSDQPSEDGMRLPLLVVEHCAPGAQLRVFLAGEVPSGTGLGSSSTMTVALIRALDAYTATHRSAAEVAALASTIEIDLLGSPIGKQDQYASAVGGLNLFTFEPDGEVGIAPVRLNPEIAERLQRRLMLFFTGGRRDAGSILAHQRKQSEEKRPRTIEALHAIKSLAVEMHAALLDGDLDAFGRLLHESWEQKRQVTSGISTAFIDHCYAVARYAGAIGGKITGAGGGGFLLLYCHEEQQEAVALALRPLSLEPFPFRFTRQGAQVVAATDLRDESVW